MYVINKFIEGRAQWIWERLKHIDFAEVKKDKQAVKVSYRKNKEEARKIIQAKVDLLNGHYAFPFKRIAIRNQRTCWGSCSRQGNLNFNYKVAFLEEELQDYIIVHDLCHLGELNHSSRFWKLVSEMVPDYKELRRKLRKIK
jgi:predicted metal-dependent hydrolase